MPANEACFALEYGEAVFAARAAALPALKPSCVQQMKTPRLATNVRVQQSNRVDSETGGSLRQARYHTPRTPSAHDACRDFTRRNMRTCEYDGDPFTEPRSHPWTTATTNAGFRYVDLKAEPSRIRTSLEDLTPWAHYPAIEALYALLTNGPGCLLESNDCAFTGLRDGHGIRKGLRVLGTHHGALSQPPWSLLARPGGLFTDALHRLAVRHGFVGGIIGTTILPVRYVTLPPRCRAARPSADDLVLGPGKLENRSSLTSVGRIVRNLSQAER